LPDFIAVGPGRSGSTWLDQVLRGHVGLPRNVKETKFFGRYYTKGIKWYASHFTRCRPDIPVGEVCSYFFLDEAPARISHFIPNCRIIVTLRDPAERVCSYYKILRRVARTSVGLEESMVRHPGIFPDHRYAEHLTDWFKTFGAENVLVTFYDDLRADHQCYLDRICDFIGIPRVSLTESPVGPSRVNVLERACKNRQFARRARRLRNWLRSYRLYRVVNSLERLGFWEFCFGRGELFLPVAPEVEQRLREFFRPEVEALEKLTGRDLSAWKRPYPRGSDAGEPSRHKRFALA